MITNDVLKYNSKQSYLCLLEKEKSVTTIKLYYKVPVCHSFYGEISFLGGVQGLPLSPSL